MYVHNHPRYCSFYSKASLQSWLATNWMQKYLHCMGIPYWLYTLYELTQQNVKAVRAVSEGTLFHLLFTFTFIIYLLTFTFILRKIDNFIVFKLTYLIVSHSNLMYLIDIFICDSNLPAFKIKHRTHFLAHWLLYVIFPCNHIRAHIHLTKF